MFLLSGLLEFTEEVPVCRLCTVTVLNFRSEHQGLNLEKVFGQRSLRSVKDEKGLRKLHLRFRPLLSYNTIR